MMATVRASTRVSTPASCISCPPEPNISILPPGLRFVRARASEAPCLSPEASPATIIILVDPERGCMLAKSKKGRPRELCRRNQEGAATVAVLQKQEGAATSSLRQEGHPYNFHGL